MVNKIKVIPTPSTPTLTWPIPARLGQCPTYCQPVSLQSNPIHNAAENIQAKVTQIKAERRTRNHIPVNLY